MIRDILDRPEHDIQIDEPLSRLAGERVLITGASGSLGEILAPLLPDAITTDIETLDVRDWTAVHNVFTDARPTIVFHLAASKQAPDGETDPEDVADTNVRGTLNVVEQGVRVVLASTCKACEAETVYGASKLIAERAVLNAGGSVARLYNVADTHGNVFEFWAQLPQEAPIPVAACLRYFVSSREAVALLLWAAILDSGRYTVDPGSPRFIPSVARTLYPGRQQRIIPARRGDRIEELLTARSETLLPVDGPSGIREIVSWHDGPHTDSLWAGWWEQVKAA